ncbi:MAG TPA: hypothetical protein VF519_02395 [Mycobacteriales bacterium]|jgi:hypothetical protein
MRRTVQRLAVSAVATAALVCAIGAPASAELEGTKGVVVVDTGVTTGVFANGLQISGTCAVVTVGAVAAVVITNCWLEGNPGAQPHSIAVSGPAAAVTFVERVTTLDFQLCWTGYVIATLDPNDPVPFGRCANGLVTGVDVVTGDVGVGVY